MGVESTKDEPLLRQTLSLDPIESALALKLLHHLFEKRAQEMMDSIPGTKMAALLKESLSLATKIREEAHQMQKKMSYPEKVLFNDDANATQTTEATAEQLNQAVAHQELLFDLQGEKAIRTKPRR